MALAGNVTWKNVCSADDLQPDSGVCALVGGQQVAIFYMAKEQAVYALHNYDPIGKANVLSRGVIGDIKGEPVVASPLYKQHFSLKTGKCLEDEQVNVPVYPVRILNGRVEVQVAKADVTEGCIDEEANA
jgi:nitrite reductase (NADH) small subunit